jgi:hypothetical protein
MYLSPPIRIDRDFGSLDVVVSIDESNLSLLTLKENGEFELIATTPLHGAQIDQPSFVSMVRKIHAEIITGSKGVRFRLSGGYRVINNAMTVRPSFVLDVLFRERPRTEYTLLSHGWKPISGQLRAIHNFLCGSDRTRDITDYYFR